jgi:hypothetical protein
MVNPPDPELPRRPWVYMGPGLFQDESGYIHIRLSSTSNDLPGFPGYRGETDPRQVPLTIWTSAGATLLISDCASVYLTDLSVRGGSTTIHIEDSDDIRLDHVSILAGSYGVYFGASCHGSVMTHCLVDGGMPPWYFRSDRKDGYTYLRNGAHAYNGLGEVTMRALMHGAPTCTQNRVSYCEFVNGHDLYMFGTELEFSRNWVSNLNDDAIFAETEEITDLRIAGNVIEQSLTAINFARKVAGNSVFVYRNLIDLRRPTASARPQPQPQPHGGTQPLELGHLFKGTSPDGPLDLFHNTILVKDQEEPSSFAYFRSYAGESRRRAFNNIFVAIDGTAGARAPISWLPKPTWPAATDGNCYHKTGPFSDGPLLRQPGYNPADDPAHFVPGHDFQSLDERPCSAPTRQASRSARGAHASHGSIFLSRDGASGNSGAVRGALPHRAGHRAPGGRKRPGTTRCAGARPHRPVEPGALTVVVQRSTCPGKPRQDGIECPL